MGYGFCECEAGQRAATMRADEDACWVAEFRAHQYVLANIPDAFQDATLDTVDIPLDLEKGMFFYGGIGTGKTYAACAVLNDYLAKHTGRPQLVKGEIVGCIGIFCDLINLWDSIRASYKEGSFGEADMLRRAKTVELLVLDDIGAEKPTDWVGEKLFQVVNTRYNSRLRTIVTSNLSPSELVKRWGDKLTGDRIVSRLQEMCEIIHLKGLDRRLK